MKKGKRFSKDEVYEMYREFRGGDVTPADLARKWEVGVDFACKLLDRGKEIWDERNVKFNPDPQEYKVDIHNMPEDYEDLTVGDVNCHLAIYIIPSSLNFKKDDTKYQRGNVMSGNIRKKKLLSRESNSYFKGNISE